MIDKQFEIIAELSVEMGSKLSNEDRKHWIGSPFEWILNQPSRRKGAIGETLVAEWCSRNGMSVTRPTSSEADRIINGHRIEIKFSTLWANGSFKFQQIRDQDYDHLLCIGLTPDEAYCWLIPKDVLYTYVIGHMGQHTGATGKDTAWLTVYPDSVPDWLKPYGSRLEDVLALFRKMKRGSF